MTFPINKLKLLLLTISIIYLAFIIADIFWFTITKEDKNIIKNDIINTAKVVDRLPLSVFGKVVVEKPKSNYKKVKSTKLDLTLVGIISKNQTSFAVIQSVAGFDKIYKVGDYINPSAKLKIIGNNFVIIDHNSRDEKLVLKFNTFNLKNGAQSTQQNTKSKQSVNKTTPIASPKIISKLKVEHKNKLKEYLQRARSNPSSILTIVRVEPNFISGLLNGFKVYPAKERELFFKIGFEANDIITKINDIELNSLAKAFKIGKELAFLKTFDFVVLRNAAEHYIYLDLN